MKRLLLLCLVLCMCVISKAQWSSTLVPTSLYYKEIVPTSGSATKPPYDFTMICGMVPASSYCSESTCTVNQTYTIGVSSTSVRCYAYFFYANNPEAYTQSFAASLDKTTGCYVGSMNITIPYTGKYVLLVVTAEDGQTGKCNLTIGSVTTVVNVGRNYMPCVQGTDQVYNTFATSNYGTCKLFVLEGNNPGKIVAYNDGYSGSGDFDWDGNPRIKKQYTNATSGVYVHWKNNGTMQSQNSARVNVYAGLKHAPYTKSFFSSLKLDDALRTAPKSMLYNCIAWAGCEWNQWVWPPNNFSDYHSSSNLAAFDAYFASRGLTRSDNNVSGAVVDLWAHVNGADTIYSHASVRTRTNDYSFGYGWESKAGALERILHPREALAGGDQAGTAGYGEIVHHYVITPAFNPDEHVFENISLSADELEHIQYQSDAISTGVKSTFNTLYNTTNSMLKNSNISNLEELESNSDYLSLLSYCVTHPDTQYLAYLKLYYGDLLATKLIDDLQVASNMGVMAQVWNYVANHQTNASGQTLNRTLQTNATLFVKGMLSGNGTLPAISQDDITYSDDSNILSVKVNGSNVEINTALPEDAVVTICMASLLGKQPISVISQQRIEKSTFRTIVPDVQKGTYVISCHINGKIYQKKITVQ